MQKSSIHKNDLGIQCTDFITLYDTESGALENPSLKGLESLHTAIIIILYKNLRSLNLVRKLRRKSLGEKAQEIKLGAPLL
jgi:hypothetical protein